MRDDGWRGIQLRVSEKKAPRRAVAVSANSIVSPAGLGDIVYSSAQEIHAKLGSPTSSALYSPVHDRMRRGKPISDRMGQSCPWTRVEVSRICDLEEGMVGRR